MALNLVRPKLRVLSAPSVFGAAALAAAVAAALLLLFYPPSAGAEPRLPYLFTDHMILQQGMSISVWGWADPEEHIAV